jgi:hypothetical protein
MSKQNTTKHKTLSKNDLVEYEITFANDILEDEFYGQRKIMFKKGDTQIIHKNVYDKLMKGEKIVISRTLGHGVSKAYMLLMYRAPTAYVYTLDDISSIIELKTVVQRKLIYLTQI